MQTAFDGIKSLGLNTLKLEQELEESWDAPGVITEDMQPVVDRKQVNQNNVLCYMGVIEEKVSTLLMETGNQFNAHSQASMSNFEQELAHNRAPSILNENDFASAVGVGNEAGEGENDVMFRSMQEWTKKLNKQM